MSYKWETKFKPGDKIIRKYDGQSGTIGSIVIHPCLEEWGGYPVGYTVLFDGYEPGEPKGESQINETGLELCRPNLMLV